MKWETENRRFGVRIEERAKNVADNSTVKLCAICEDSPTLKSVKNAILMFILKYSI